MALPPYPLPREIRETSIQTGSGVATYGPFTFKIFDENDVEVWRLDDGATEWALQAVTVTKTADLAHDYFSITFPANVPATTTFRVSGRRLHERQVAVTRGGTIDSTMLEKELSKQGAILQELRRDLGRTVRFPPGFAGQPYLPVMTAGSAIIVNASGDGLAIGPTATQIASAQAYAESALLSKDAAALSVADAANYAALARNDKIVKTFPADGETTDFDLIADPGSANNCDVFVDGVRVPSGSYSLAGTVLSFIDAPFGDGIAHNIEVAFGYAVTIGTPADGAVTTPKLGALAVTAAKLDNAAIETKIAAATAKTTLADADVFALLDSAAASVLKKVTWANIKAALATAFAARTADSFTATLTGCTTSPTGTVAVEKVGNIVTLSIPSITGTANTTAASLTGVPVAYRPSAERRSAAPVYDNTVTKLGLVSIGTGGTIDLFSGLNAEAFTAAGTKGFRQFTITYAL